MFPVRGYGKKKHVKTPHLECSGKMYLAVICPQNLLRKGKLILKIRLKQVWLLSLNMTGSQIKENIMLIQLHK